MITKKMQEMKEIDRIAIEEYHIPSLDLMENAARCVTEETLKLLDGKTSALAVCGMGNNGGDGYAAARLLKERGIDVTVVTVGNEERITKDALENKKRLVEYHIPCIPFESMSEKEIKETFSRDVIIDAIFGVGITREVQGVFREVIKKINESQAKVLSCDLPSGIHGDTGEELSVSVKADETVTFTFMKEGMMKGIGKVNAGSVKVVHIGIPEKVTKEQA